MALARCNFAVQDEAGNIVDGASVEVRRESVGLPLVSVFSDRDGAVPLGNPFVAADGADAGFHVAGGAYQITATKDSFTRTWHYVAVGLGAESDAVPVDGVSAGFVFNFNTATSGDPGTGGFLFNHATFGSITAINISVFDSDGNGLASYLDTWDDGTSTIRGEIKFQKPSNGAFRIFAITGTLTDNGDWNTYSVTPIATGGAAFGNGDECIVTFVPKGDKGDTGAHAGFVQAFDSSTSDADPGAGEFRLNHATPTSATAIYLDNVDASGTTISSIIDLFDDSTNTIKGTLKIEKVGDPAIAYQWNVTGSVVDGTGYRKVTLQDGVGAGTLVAGVQFAISFARAGNVGADGTDPGVLLTWDTTTTDSDPGGPGGIRADNASLASATLLYVDKTGRGGSDIEAFLLALDDSTNTVKGTLILTQVSDDTQATFNITGVTDATGYVKIAVSGHSGATTFTNAAAISFQFSRAGNVGASGASGASTLSRVRVVATSNVALASGLEDGDTIDGVTLATGDIVLLAGQTAPAENGVYTVVASGAASRSTGFTAYNDIAGSYFAVMEGTVHADELWRCKSDAGGTIDSTAIEIFGGHYESKVDAASGVTLTTNVAANITSLTLQPGHWNVTSVAKFNLGASSCSNIISGLSTTSATLGGDTTVDGIRNFLAATLTDNTRPSLVGGTVHMHLSVATTIYLVARAGFSGDAVVAWGVLQATPAL